MPTTKNEIAESILIVSSVPLLLVAGAKCLLLNAYALRVPGFSWAPHIQQRWLAWAMVYWSAFLAVCAVLLTLLRKRFGYFALIALGVSKDGNACLRVSTMSTMNPQKWSEEYFVTDADQLPVEWIEKQRAKKNN